MAAEYRNLVYEGSSSFRIRVILATLSGKSITIKKIRHKDQNTGIRDYEVNLMQLIEQVTKGSRVQLSESATRMNYQPGMLSGGRVEHACHSAKSVGYYLEVLVCLAAFMKSPLHATLTGVTNNDTDTSVDMVRLSTLPVLKRFLGTDEGLEIKVVKRGAAPGGGGEVLFTCPTRQKLRPVQLTSAGKIKRIRGISWATRVDARVCNRMVDSARQILNRCLTDVYIHTDHNHGAAAGKSPGFGLTLLAESTEGVVLCAELCSPPGGSPGGECVPEDLAQSAAKLLLDEIRIGGCVDSTNQALACLLMTLGDKDVSKMEMGPLTDYTISMLRHIKEFLNITFKIDQLKSAESVGENKLLLSCVGAGYRNLSKAIL